MANKTPTKKQRQDYVEFLQKRLKSKNYKNNVPAEEFAKTTQALANEKLKLKTMK